jgi:GAF domain-containing protein
MSTQSQEGFLLLQNAVTSLVTVANDLRIDLIRRKIADRDRLAVLQETGLLDIDKDDVFDKLTFLTAKILKVPLSFIALVAENDVHFVSKHAEVDAFKDIRVLPVEKTLCVYEVALAVPMVIRDAKMDEIAKVNPAVTENGISAYIGVPLIKSGAPIGTLCACDVVPRDWTDDDLEILKELSSLVLLVVEMRTLMTKIAAS